MRRRLLTIGHSYCVRLNRRLAHEIARTGDWDVTVVAPDRFRGDHGWHTTERDPGEACAVEAVPIRFGRPVHLMTYGARLATLMKQPWDVVHCWEEPYVRAAGQVARLTPPGVPLVFATFQNIAKRYPPPFGWIERRALKRASGVIAYGWTVRDTLEGRGVPHPSVRVIPPGVDVDLFRPDADARAAVRQSLGWPDDVPVVGFLGRFVPEKGITTLMRMLDRLKTPWRALLVGSGPLESDLRLWGAGYGDRVRLRTNVDHDRVPAYLNAMDVLCAPSQTTPKWREQFGRMLIEAFACGVPVVAATSGEIPYVVGDAGVLVFESDVRAWTTAVQRLLEDPPIRSVLGAAGRQRAETMFAWPVVAARHVEFFEELRAGAAGRGGKAPQA